MAENNIPEQEVYEVDKLNLLDCKKIRLAKEESGFRRRGRRGSGFRQHVPE